MTRLGSMAPARSPWLAAVALVGVASLWACGSTNKASPSASGGEAPSSAGTSSAGASSGGHAGTLAGGGDAGFSPSSGNAGSFAGDDAGAGGGVVAVGEGGAGGVAEGGSAGVGGACTQSCTTMNAGAFCEQDEVTWVCEPGFDAALFNARCRDPATALIRYCCPPEFTGECP